MLAASLALAVPPAAADPADTGEWGPLISWPEVSIHAALLHTGRVLTWQGDFSEGGEQYVFDPAAGSATHVPAAQADLFCAGQAVTADGRILVIGGTATSGGAGIRNTTAFDPATETWTDLAPMHWGRWYATGTTLASGNVLVTSGYDRYSGDIVETPEVYNVQANTWSQLTNAAESQPVYPFQFQLPNGRVLWAGASEAVSATKVLDVGSQQWSTVDDRAIDGGSIANYAPGKFIKAGSAADSGDSGDSLATAYTLDMNQAGATWQPTGNMATGRSFLNLTNLPDGTVLATGGDTTRSAFDDSKAALSAELWNPATGTWKTLASMSAPRLYHSVALLLPDGRVFVSGGGGSPPETDQNSIQLFSPPYLFKGPRPTITSAPKTVSYGTTATIDTPQAGSITSVALLRTGSVTHGFDQNARALKLSFTRSSGAVNVQLPASANTAPPGYYMLFLVNGNGVPSVAAMVRFPAGYESAKLPESPAAAVKPTTSPPRPVRARIRVLGWKGRRLYVRVRCPGTASSMCRVKLALRTPAARTLSRKRIAVGLGHRRLVSLSRHATKFSRRRLRLRVLTRTSAGAVTFTKRLRSARLLEQRPRR